jgi:hypothetical protein
MTDFEPTLLHNGLALYSTDAGEPLLLMPYPHGFGVAPIVQGPLAAVLHELNQQVISFDPPGAFNTTRPAQVNMPEMLGCPQAPVPCSEELATGIPSARLVIFERSGHYPFVEERSSFQQTLAEFSL